MLRNTSISIKNTIPAASRGRRALKPPLAQPKSTAATTAESERQALTPERSETSQSGTDNKVASHKSSYDPSTITPESELQALENECRIAGMINPLFISPANREFSELLDPKVEGAVQNADKLRAASGRGWTRKHKEVHVQDVHGSPYDRYQRLLEELKKHREGLVHS